MSEIIFDRDMAASFGVQDDPNNSPEQLVKRRTDMLNLIAEMCSADSVEYVDGDKSEEYIITKKEQKFWVGILSNSYDGGWLTIRKVPRYSSYR